MCLRCVMEETGIPTICSYCNGFVAEDDHFQVYKNGLYHLLDCYLNQLAEDLTVENGVLQCHKCRIPLNEVDGAKGVIAHHPFCPQCLKEILDERGLGTIYQQFE